MSKKIIYLISFVLVLGLFLSNVAHAFHPAPVAWWKFDGDALDSSGNGHHGTLMGNPGFVQGVFGQALDTTISGGDPEYVVITGFDGILGGNPFSITAWINTSDTSGTFMGWGSTAGGTTRFEFRPDADELRAESSGNVQGLTTLPNNEWIHIAVTVAADAIISEPDVTLYLNGQVDNDPSTGGGASLQMAAGNDVTIARRHTSGRWFDALIDDVRLYGQELTQQEVQDAMAGIGPTPPGVARKPSPEDELTDVPRDMVLSWIPGDYAPAVNGHKVYFSENFSDVNDGVGGIAQDANSYAPPHRLDFSTTYYWRVDEVNGAPDYTVHEGAVWSFTTEPFAYAVENITATASSGEPSRGPENTVNGSGMDDSSLLHDKVGDGNMWLSNAAGPQPAWIEFQFDKVYKLHEMWVWNSNESMEPVIGFGFKDVVIEYSVNGTDYTTLGTTHEFARAPGTPDYAHNTTVDFSGVGAKYVRLTANSNWGGLLPQYGLSEVRFLYIPVLAREPYPADGATDVSIGTIAEPIDVVLGFRAGRQGATHNVYLSTDEQAVVDGTADVTTVTETSYGPLSVDLGQTYYWRVDEVNEAETPATWQGDIWDFTVQEYSVVDDFESYNDLDPMDPESKRIFLTWIDGYEQPTNGSIVGYTEPPFTEQGTVQGGSQSMPLFYDNTAGAAYSEAELTLSPPQDWTRSGVKALSLWFYGDPNNGAEQMYVKLNGSKVVYDGDARDITKARWTQWNIDLASFGTNLQNITKLSIGIGDDTPGTPGGSGMVLFDSIWLYPARCMADILKLGADLNYDCVVDYLDLEIMAADWFETDSVISTAAPSPSEMVVQYKLDGNASDSSGSNNHGMEMQGPTYIAGKFGQAINLDGSNDYVAIQNFHYDNASGLTAVTVAAWVRTSVSSNQIIVTFDRNEYWRLQIAGEAGGPGLVGFEVMTDTGQVDTDEAANWPANTGRVDDGQWHHLAGVFDNGTLTIYIDGNPKEPYSGGATFGSGDAVRYGYLGVGSESTAFDLEPRTPANFFDGDLDDVYIYHRALTPAEIAYLADETPGDGELYIPVPSVANMSDEEPVLSRSVNFKDFALLADGWLDEQLWP